MRPVLNMGDTEVAHKSLESGHNRGRDRRNHRLTSSLLDLPRSKFIFRARNRIVDTCKRGILHYAYSGSAGWVLACSCGTGAEESTKDAGNDKLENVKRLVVCGNSVDAVNEHIKHVLNVGEISHGPGFHFERIPELTEGL